MEAEFRHVLERLDINQALTTPLASTVSGEIIPVGGSMDVEHWVKQLASPVLFEQAFTGAMMYKEQSCGILLELGPKPVLTKMANSWWNPTDTQSDPLWIPTIEQGVSFNLEESFEMIASSIKDARLLHQSTLSLSSVFPHRVKIPWPESHPHPLLQHSLPIGSKGTEYSTVFHNKLLELYRHHVVPGSNLFPGAGYIEMCLAAGARMPGRGADNGVELVDIKFIRPFYLEKDCVMTSSFYNAGGMEFYQERSGVDNDVTKVATISQVNVGISMDNSSNDMALLEQLRGWKDDHTIEIEYVQSRYVRLAELGFHTGPFQTIEAVWLNGTKRSTVGRLRLPDDWSHEHDAYYCVHPALLDGAFQLSGILMDVSESEEEIWVPARISSLRMYRQANFQGTVWARVKLASDGLTGKAFNIDIFDEHGLLMMVEDFLVSKFQTPEAHLSKSLLHTTKWIESSFPKTIQQDTMIPSSFAVVKLSDVAECDSVMVNELNATVIELKALLLMHMSEMPENLVVPLLNVTSLPSSSSIVEECLELLQYLSSKVKDQPIRRLYGCNICFLTVNSEGPPLSEQGLSDCTNDMAMYSSVLGGSVWGLVRTAVLELEMMKQISILCMDTDLGFGGDGSTLAKQIQDELCGSLGTTESEVSYRDNHRFVRRISKGNSITKAEETELVVSENGGIANLIVSSFHSYADVLPEDSVEVSVHATGLNFKDVLNVVMPDSEELYVVSKSKAPPPGAEFAGIVTVVPTSSNDCPFAVGDRVYGTGLDMFRSKARVLTNSIAKMPKCLSFEEASTLPVVFMTVDIALGEQAHLKQGDRILIHSAAGGVGLAAIQYAKYAGAEIFATASPSKHEYLRSIGVKNISTSRDGRIFTNEMTELIGGQGVDVVLSAGNLIEESLALLVEGGCFLEIAKLNVFTQEEMWHKRPDVRYSIYTPGETMRDNPHQIQSRLESLSSQVEKGIIRPLPLEVFDYHSGIRDAFNRLRSGKTIGKVAVRIQKGQEVGVAIVTGGLGGLGLVAAEVLLEMGADHVVLVSRSGKVPDYANQDLQSRLSRLMQLRDGTAVSIERCDVSDESVVATLLEGIRNNHGSINTIVQSSGVLCDRPFNEMDHDSLWACFAPKAAGTWHLHKQTMDDDIHNFVVFSSVVGLLGNPRQANHSASNSYLNSLVRLRRQMELPAISIQWPAVAEVGKAASLQKAVGWSDKEMLSLTDTKLVLMKAFSSNCSSLSIQESIWAPLVRHSLSTYRQHPRLSTLLSMASNNSEQTCNEVFVALGEHTVDTNSQTELSAQEYMAYHLLKYLKNNPATLSKHPWLENTFKHARSDAPPEEPVVNRDLYNESLHYRMSIDLYNGLPRLLEDPLRVISLHPEHDAMYESGVVASSSMELTHLLGLVCNEWHGTQLRAFEVGTGTGGLTRRVVPIIEDRLESYVCSDIFDIRLGALHSHPAISRVKYDVNNDLIAEDKYHIILSSNAVHIAKDVQESLERLCSALEEGGMMLLEEAISQQPLYLHGLDKFIWETATDDRSFGLWMSWSEWLDVINLVEGLELLAWYRSPSFVSMLLHKATSKHNAKVQPPSITSDMNKLSQILNDGDANDVVYCGPDADDVVKALVLARPSTILVKSFTSTDNCEFDLNHLPLRFNTLKGGRLGAVIPIKSKPSGTSLTKSSECQVLKLAPNVRWNKDTISVEVEKAVHSVATIGTAVTHTTSLMDAGLDSLAVAELSSVLRSQFNVELPSTIIFNHPTIADITDHLFSILLPEAEEPCVVRNSSIEQTNETNEFSIVGISCHFPGDITSPSEYWQLLSDGRNTSSQIPFDRWDAASMNARSNLSEKEKMQVSHGSFVNDIECFDPTVFSISKAEAESMSPVQRILLESSHLALFDAGYSADEMKGLDCGVFVGASTSSGATGRPSSSNDNSTNKHSVYNVTGSSASIASGRISFVFNFKGPNSVYDTACSSSLVALDAAMSALRERKCEMALVAGANDLFDTEPFEGMARAGMLSPTGQCHTFDESADG